MAQVSQLSPELERALLHVARALLAAARNWSLYPPEHPTVRASVARLGEVIRQSSPAGILSIGVTPATLMIEGAAADASQAGIAEAAALLHDRDLITVTFVGDIAPDTLRAFLRLLALDAAERRSRGGPAHIWADEQQPSIALEQIDYEQLLAREGAEVPEAARRDDVWESIVRTVTAGPQAMFDEQMQQRLLAIAGSPADISDLAAAVMEPKRAVDGSPMITSQAAAVLAAFRHLTNIVSVRAPERLSDVMSHLASAATQLDAHVMMQVLQSEDDPAATVSVVKGLAGAFDDVKVAQLLATALALDGKASDRLATIFNTIAPDEDRKRRVLTMTRTLLQETDFGRAGQFHALWTSMEELLVSYDDKPFVSEVYRASLDGLGGRAERMAAGELPPELPEWMVSLGQANVRQLSVTLLIDLLALERDPAQAAHIAGDMEALAEDLLMSGAYDDALTVTKALAGCTTATDRIGRDACRLALDHLGESLALRETAAVAGELDADAWAAVSAVLRTIGVASVEALKGALLSDADTTATRRVEETIAGFGPPAIKRLASLVGDARPVAQWRGARLLGRIGTADAVPLLQPLLRHSDPRVVREAITAVRGIPDPAAARAVQTLLRAATGAGRRAVVEALVADRDVRVVPLLVRILDESDPLGADHDVVIEALGALATVGSDAAVPTVAALAGRRAWFGRAKLRTLKERSVDALLAIATPRAEQALADARRTGDRMLKRIVAAKADGSEAR